MTIAIIAACDLNRLIGVDGTLPWTLPEDLRRFKKLTMGSTVIMGRKTFESMGSKPLPGRINVVIAKDPSIPIREHGFNTEVIIEPSLPDALRRLRNNIFLIGGQRIYEEGLQYADVIYLTRIQAAFFGVNDHRYFPKIDPKTWVKAESESHEAEGITFETYRRILP